MDHKLYITSYMTKHGVLATLLLLSVLFLGLPTSRTSSIRLVASCTLSCALSPRHWRERMCASAFTCRRRPTSYRIL